MRATHGPYAGSWADSILEVRRLRHGGAHAHYGPTATPVGPFWPEAITFAPVPSRLASLIVPLVLVISLAQYTWLAPTATPYGLPLPEAMVFAPVPFRLAST